MLCCILTSEVGGPFDYLEAFEFMSNRSRFGSLPFVHYQNLWCLAFLSNRKMMVFFIMKLNDMHTVENIVHT